MPARAAANICHADVTMIIEIIFRKAVAVGTSCGFVDLWTFDVTMMRKVCDSLFLFQGSQVVVGVERLLVVVVGVVSWGVESLLHRLMDVDREFLVEFLIGDVPTRRVEVKSIKAKAYERLTKKMREKNGNADENFVKRKLMSLITNYKSELKKIIESKNQCGSSGGGGEAAAKLWIY